MTKHEPYFVHETFKLYCGDSLKLLRVMPDNCVDMVFADPPYFLSNGGISVQAGKMVSVNKGDWDKSRGFEDDFVFFDTWISELKRVLKPHGSLWISGTYHSIYLCGYALARNGYKILNDITWYKPNAAPNLSCRYFTASHETILWAKPDKHARHTFNYDLMRNGNWSEDRMKVPNKQMRSVWSINTVPREEKLHGKHPTQKPLKLLERIVLSSTNPDDVVLDPFTGSSTTGLACHKHGRKFIGFDIEKDYLDLSIKRFQDIINTV
jgi:site-specific DNA-methyltransferase (adenine-specific)